MRLVLEDERGQAAALAVFLIFLLALLFSGMVDLYRMQETRNWAYRAAESAALAGAAAGRDFDSFVIDPGLALTAAEETLQAALAWRGETDAAYDIRVLEYGGTIADFPPVARSDLWGTSTEWTSNEPAVGVYLEVPVSTMFLGLGNGPVRVHAFAAAGCCGVLGK
ncbi:MAG: hypothetical protein ACP5N6_09515 [Anaerolineae bacterium]